jgi:ketosteroid isomerase-like protein
LSVSPEPVGLANARRFLLGYFSDELDEVVHLLSDDVTYTVPGHMAVSGVFHGPKEVKEHLTRLLAFSLSTFDVLKWVDWLVGETHVAVLQYAQVQAHGSIYRGHQLYVVEVDADDRLSDIKVFFEDQEAAARFFAP